jgi:hypothetical protein
MEGSTSPRPSFKLELHNSGPILAIVDAVNCQINVGFGHPAPSPKIGILVRFLGWRPISLFARKSGRESTSGHEWFL